MKYEVPTKFVFSGTFTIEADSPAQAKEFVQKHCGLVIGGNIHTTLADDDCDWDFPIHPNKITGRTRKIK
jgi:hypothetical protein